MADVPRSEEEQRIAELLRVNRELATEIRDLALGRRTEPRSSQLPATRRVAKLETERDALAAQRDALAAERDSLAAELEARRAELDGLRRHGEELAKQVHDQAGHVEALSHEVARLRGGAAGILRRLRARLLLRR